MQLYQVLLVAQLNLILHSAIDLKITAFFFFFFNAHTSTATSYYGLAYFIISYQIRRTQRNRDHALCCFNKDRTMYRMSNGYASQSWNKVYKQ